MLDVREAVERACDLAHRYFDPEKNARTRQRQAATLAWEPVDYLPIIFDVKVLEADTLPEYDWQEQWYDPAKSFVAQIKGQLGPGAAPGDFLPSVRADLGVINGPSLFGVGFQVPEHTKPVVDRFIAKEALCDFSLPDDIRDLGVMPRLIEHIQHHAAVLKAHGLEAHVDLTHCDTQGPFDIADQVLGHHIFTEIYDDPDFIHHLMTEATRAFIAVTRLCKELQGEHGPGGNAAGFWMQQGGMRICDDSGILLSRDSFAEFVLPYHAQALSAFDGGWLHYCGGVPGGGRAEGLHLHDLYCSLPQLYGFNFTTGQDWEAEIRKVRARHVAYIGGLHRPEGEPLEAYLTRVAQLAPERTGFLFAYAFDEAEWDAVVPTWQRVQDNLS
jgi:hypothetical protein